MKTYLNQLKEKTNIDVTSTTIDDNLISVSFNIEGKKETGSIYYRVGREEMTVEYHPEDGKGTGTEIFNYGEPLSVNDIFEAVIFGHKFLKDSL